MAEIKLEDICPEAQLRNGTVVCSRRPGIKTCKYQGAVVRITESNLLSYENPAERTYPMWTCQKACQQYNGNNSGGST